MLVYWLVASKPIWYGPYPYGVKQAGAGALFQGIRGVRAGLDRPRRAGRRGRRRPLDEPQRPLHGEPERVLQPQRRPGLLHRSPDATVAIGELPVAVDKRTGIVRLADGSAVRPGYLLTDGSVEPDAIPVARDPLLGMTVWKVNGPLVLAKTTHHRHLPERHVVGPSRDLVAGALPRRLPHGLALGRRAAAARRQHRVDASPARSVHVVPNKVGHPPRPAHARAAARARSSSTSRRPPCRAR